MILKYELFSQTYALHTYKIRNDFNLVIFTQNSYSVS